MADRAKILDACDHTAAIGVRSKNTGKIAVVIEAPSGYSPCRACADRAVEAAREACAVRPALSGGRAF